MKNKNKISNYLKELTDQGKELLLGPFSTHDIEETISAIIHDLIEKERSEHDFDPYCVFEPCEQEIKWAIDKYYIQSQYERRITKWIISCQQILEHAGLYKYLNRFLGALGDDKFPKDTRLAELVGIVESAHEMLDAGFDLNLKSILHADFFDSLDAQAEELNANGYTGSAAVICRIILEQWLRDLSEQQGLKDFKTTFVSKLLPALPEEIIGGSRKIVEAYLNLGNKAAHNKASNIDSEHVKKVIDFIKKHCIARKTELNELT